LSVVRIASAGNKEKGEEEEEEEEEEESSSAEDSEDIEVNNQVHALVCVISCS
jgi:hypothetical protein